jgi:uncharacterized lipoprotein YbaY
MRLSPVLISAVILLAACGSSTGPSAPTYQTAVAQTTVRHDNITGDYLRDITVHVTSAGVAAPAGVAVSYQLTEGSVAPLPLVTDASGNVSLTWTIPVLLTSTGQSYHLGFCARAAGSQCSIDMNGVEVVHAAF